MTADGRQSVGSGYRVWESYVIQGYNGDMEVHMSLLLELPKDVEDRIRTEASRSGKSPNAYAGELVERRSTEMRITFGPARSSSTIPGGAPANSRLGRRRARGPL